jgi:hypothetical protein
MRRRIIAITAALPLLLAGALTASAQTKTPQEPRGEESSQSATPRGQLPPTPSEDRAQRTTPGSGTVGASPQRNSTPQEPRGEESSQSATPRGQQPRQQ